MKNKSTITQLPGSIWVLGFVSLLMDLSSEITLSILPLFLTTILGATTITIGIITGLSESTALIVKMFSGALSDYLGQRKNLTVIGYALSAMTKPIFAIASSSYLILAARIFDRIGKGIRGAPRDALLADLAPIKLRGSAFGLRQALDTVGAVIGPLFAVCLMFLLSNNFRYIFWIAVIPGILSVLLLIIGVKEPIHHKTQKRISPFIRQNLSSLSLAYWWLVAIGAIFTLARFSEAFLVLRAMNVGISITFAPFVMVIMNFIYATSAYPFGKLADRMSHSKLLILGVVVLFVADLLISINNNILTLILGISLWGLHLGMTQGLLAAMVADASPINLRGTAYGFFNLASGLMTLISCILAGFLWKTFSPSTTFYMGAIFCIITFIGLILRHFYVRYLYHT